MENPSNHPAEERLEEAVEALQLATLELQEEQKTEKASLLSFLYEKFFSSSVVSKESEKQIQEKLDKAFRDIRAFYPLIHKWKDGSSKQKQFAEKVLTAIHSYNQVCKETHLETTKKDQSDGKLKQFIKTYWKDTLKIPKKPLHIFHQVRTRKDDPIVQITQKTLENVADLTDYQPLEDLLAMKALSFMQKEASIPNPIEILKKSKREITVDPGQQGLLLTATWKLFPGHAISVTGTFKEIDTLRKKFILDSYTFDSDSLQTGFPHPSQYSGWALSPSLLPINPLNPEHLPTVANLLKNQAEIVRKLQVEKDPVLFSRTHALYEARKKCFEKKPQYFLNAHQDLLKAIVKASPALNKTKFLNCIEQTFSGFSTPAKGIEELPNLFYQFMVSTVERPVDVLEEVWLTQKNEGLIAENKEMRRHIAADILIEAMDEQWKKLSKHPRIAFLTALRELFEHVFITLILQHFSEKIGFKPPLLSDFERKIQASLLQQQALFLSELTQEDESAIQDLDLISDHLTMLLEKDTRLFLAEDFDNFHHIMQEGVEELEVYYNFGYLLSDPSP